MLAFKWNALIKTIKLGQPCSVSLHTQAVCLWKECALSWKLQPPHSASVQTHAYRRELHLFGAPLSFLAALASVFLPCADVVAAAFWVLSLGVVCAAAEAVADSAEVLEDLEACAGFEVVLEGCRRRLPSSPAEDEGRLLLLPSSPIGGCREKS